MYLSLILLVGGVLMTILTTTSATICRSEGYVLKEAVRYVPKTRMEYEEVAKSLHCSPTTLKVTFLITTWKNGTLMGCFCDEKIYGKYCAELNSGSKYRVQANYGAPCDKFAITPCPDLYYSSESYLVWQCFEEYGNILTPWELNQEIENYQRTINDLKRELKKHEMKEQCTCTSTAAVIGYCVLSVVACVTLGVIMFIVKKYHNSIIFHIRRLFSNSQTQHPHALNSVTIDQNTQGSNSRERRNDENNEDSPSVFISSSTETTTQSTAIEDSSQKKSIDNENESMDKAGEVTYDANPLSLEEADLLCENVKHSITNDDDTDDDVDDELEQNENETAAFQISTTVSRS